MSMSDPIADMLSRMRNAITAGHASFDVPASRLKEQVCSVLKREGFIRDYRMTDTLGSATCSIRVSLKYLPDRSPVIQGVRRVSKPSLRVYKSTKEIRPVRSGMGISIISTPQGVMTGKQARANKVGGELLCEVW